MPKPRTYLVGLPVTATVHDDGTVTYWVDTSETDSAMYETDTDDLPDADTMREDQRRIQADHMRRFDNGEQTL